MTNEQQLRKKKRQKKSEKGKKKVVQCSFKTVMEKEFPTGSDT